MNGFLTTYWNAEALSDSDQTHLVNEAYVIWANDTQAAWAGYSNDVADARGQQTLDDAQSANDAWHDINLATLIWYSDNAVAGNDYLDAVIPLESDYYSSMESAWVDYSVATNNAHATKTISIADARAATVRRWADGMAGSYPGIYAEFLADMEEATAARTETQELASAGYSNAMVAAGAVWVETVLPAWVTYEDEVSDHTVSWVDTSSLAWETRENDIADAGLDYTTAAVPVGTQLTEDLNQNFSDWVSDVATADETYSNELADHAVTYIGSVTSAEESWADDTIVNWTTYVHTNTELDVMLAGAIGGSLTTWAGAVSSQLTGNPYTPPATSNPLQQVSSSNSSGTGVVAYGNQGAAGDGVTWYNPFTWMNPWFNQANLDEAELAEYEDMIKDENRILGEILDATGVLYSSLDEVPDQVLVDLYDRTAAQAATVRSPRRLEQEEIQGGARALDNAQTSLYVAAAADGAALAGIGIAAASPIVIATEAEAVTAFGGQSAFGTAIGLGRGAAAAILRAQTITLAELQAAGVTLPIARYWLQLYQNAVNNGTGGATAPERVKLFQRMVELLGG